MFDSIATLAVASNMRELYRLVLVDTPLAPYFSESLSAGVAHPPDFGSCLVSTCQSIITLLAGLSHCHTHGQHCSYPLISILQQH